MTSSTIFSQVTDSIIESLERGVRPWAPRWSTACGVGGVLPVRHNGEPYRGINILMLWNASLRKEYPSPYWMTFKQARALGGSVRSKERHTKVFYIDRFVKTEENDDGDEEDISIPYTKPYPVFNTEQIDGLPDKYYPTVGQAINPDDREERIDDFFQNTGADVRYGGNRAFYTLRDDYIQLPYFQDFIDAHSFYATQAHEFVHWTRHPIRLNREFGRKKWGDAGYAREEVTAEIGAGFLCAHFDISAEPRDDHSSYIATWLEILHNDSRFIFQAAAHAQRAVQFLCDMQPAHANAA